MAVALAVKTSLEKKKTEHVTSLLQELFERLHFVSNIGCFSNHFFRRDLHFELHLLDQIGSIGRVIDVLSIT